MQLIFNDQYLNLLLLINGVIILLYYGAEIKAKKRAMKFGNFETLKKVTGGRMIKSGDISLFLRVIGFSILIIGISGPVLVHELPSTDSSYVVALDSSASMTASDIEPTRLEAAKEMITGFVNSLPEQSQIGLVSYSGEVDLQRSLTDDKQSIAESVENISLGSSAGTTSGDAIIAGSTLLAESDLNRTLLLITDGKTNIGSNISESVEYAQSRNVTVNAIGIGSSNQSSQELNPEGIEGVEADFPNLETRNLQRVTNSTGGELRLVADRDSFETAFNSIKSQDVRTDISTELILLGLIILLGEWIFNITKYRILP